MKFLIILLAMAGAAAGAFHSYQSRDQYIQAALLSEAFNLTAPIKLRVADHYLQAGRMPHANAEAALPPPRSLYGTTVKRVAIERGGVIRVDFDERIGSRSMLFTPTVGRVGGQLEWSCASDSIPRNVLAKLQPACSYLPSTIESHLMNAIANVDGAAVRTLLSKNADVNVVINGNSPLMLAARIGNTAIIEQLIAAGARIDNATLGAERRTPLMIAITSAHADAARLLLSRGASGTLQDHAGKTAIDHARETDQRLGGNRFTLLVSAAFNPQFAGQSNAAVEAALNAGIRPEAWQSSASEASDDLSGSRLETLFSQLVSAADSCHVVRLATLLRGVGDLQNPTLLDGRPLATHIRKPACRARLATFLQTRTSFHRALHARFEAVVTACDLRAVETMLRSYPELDVNRNLGSGSHFQRAVLAGCTEVVGLLIRERSLAGQLDSRILVDAIERAPAAGLLRLVGLLIEAGAEVNTPNTRGQLPLAAAIALEQPVVAKYLVDGGADVNAPSANGSYPIIEATKKGYAHLVSQLIAEGANLNVRDDLGRTALLVAVANGQQRMVEPLLRAGADTRARDANGIDAMVLAESRNHRQIKFMLSAAPD